MSTSVLKALISKYTHPVFSLSRQALAMSTSVLKALPGELDIKRHSPSILYISRCMKSSISHNVSIIWWLVCAISFFRPGEKTEKRNNEMAQTSHHTIRMRFCYRYPTQLPKRQKWLLYRGPL